MWLCVEKCGNNDRGSSSCLFTTKWKYVALCQKSVVMMLNLMEMEMEMDMKSNPICSNHSKN